MTNFNGNPNIGLYAFASDSFCLVGHEVPDSQMKLLHKVLKVPVSRITIAGTNLVGVFVVGNSKVLLVPDIAFDEELAMLDRLKIDYRVISTTHTALGNNILMNDHGCIMNPEMEIDGIRKALDIPIKACSVAGHPTVGSCAAMNRKGLLLHRDATAAEKDIISGILKLEIETGSVNMGNPYIRSGIICNTNGYVIGDLSGGPEIQNADIALGFARR